MPGLRVRLGVFVYGEESLLVARRVCGHVALVCASGDRRKKCSLCDMMCEVHGLPARRIKSGCFPLTMSTVNNCWSSRSV